MSARQRLAALLDRAEAMLTASTIKATASVGDMESSYRNAIAELVQGLLRGGKRLSKAQFRSDMKGAIGDYAREGFRVAWEEGGGDVNETETADLDLVNEWRDEQRGFVNDFSDWLTNKDSDLDAVPDRLDAWALSYSNFLQRVSARAQGDPMLTYDGDDGQESCDECQEYKGQAHRLSWWEKRGLTKRNGNGNFSCGRWEPCQHHFYNKAGALVIT